MQNPNDRFRVKLDTTAFEIPTPSLSALGEAEESGGVGNHTVPFELRQRVPFGTSVPLPLLRRFVAVPE